MHKWLMEKGKCLKTEMENHGIDNLTKTDLEEAYYYSKILKNLMCLEKDGKIVEAMENAENEDNMDMIEQYEDYPEKRYYRGQPRSKTTGRYMSRGDGRRGYMHMPIDDMDYRMDMDMYNQDPKKLRDMDKRMGRMYYTENGSNGSDMGNSQSGNGGMRSYTDGYSDGMRDGQQRDSREGRSGNARKKFYESKEIHKSGNQEDNTQNMKMLETFMNILDEDMSELKGMMSPSEKTFAKQRIVSMANKMQ